MISIARYFLGNTCLGEAQISTEISRPHSFAFFCSTCGDIWGRVWVEGAVWELLPRPCEEHKPVGVWDWGEYSGSFVSSMYSKDFVGAQEWPLTVEHLPREVMMRELLLTMKKVENDNAAT